MSIIIHRLNTFTRHFLTFLIGEKLQNRTGADAHALAVLLAGLPINRQQYFEILK